MWCLLALLLTSPASGGSISYSGLGGGKFTPTMYIIDFTEQSETWTAGSSEVVQGVTFEAPNPLGGTVTGISMDSNGLHLDGGGASDTSWLIIQDLTDFDASIDLTDGEWAFWVAFDADPTAGLNLGLQVGSDVISTEPNFPNFAGFLRENNNNRFKVYGSTTQGGWHGDYFSTHVPDDVRGMGFTIRGASANTFWSTVEGSTFPPSATWLMSTNATSGGGTHTYSDGSAEQLVIVMPNNVNFSSLTIWDTDAPY